MQQQLGNTQQQLDSVQQQLTAAEAEVQRQGLQLRKSTEDRNRLQVRTSRCKACGTVLSQPETWFFLVICGCAVF